METNYLTEDHTKLLNQPLESLVSGCDIHNLDAVDLPVETAGLLIWNKMTPSQRDRILGGLLRNLVKRSIKHVPLYRDDPRWQKVNPDDIANITDILELPLLSKDPIPGTGSPDHSGIAGFREKILANPKLLIPDNLTELVERQKKANPYWKEILFGYHGEEILGFGSGGSMGKSTKTLLSFLTIEMEAYALARCLHFNGFNPGQKIACFYAPTHKGGLQLERAAAIMHMTFHSKDQIYAAVKKYSGRYGEAIDGLQKKTNTRTNNALIRSGIRRYIKEHEIEVIESVQPPAQFMDSNEKGNSLAFMDIFNEDPDSFKTVKHVFLTGFPVPKEAYETLRTYGIEVSTTWGSTETMALATYPCNHISDNVNDLVAAHFPTVGVVAHYKERSQDSPKLVEVPVGNDGLLFVTSLIGVGSNYLNYMIGDLCYKTAQGFQDINRVSTKPAAIAGSCAEDALSL